MRSFAHPAQGRCRGHGCDSAQSHPPGLKGERRAFEMDDALCVPVSVTLASSSLFILFFFPPVVSDCIRDDAEVDFCCEKSTRLGHLMD